MGEVARKPLKRAARGRGSEASRGSWCTHEHVCTGDALHATAPGDHREISKMLLGNGVSINVHDTARSAIPLGISPPYIRGGKKRFCSC